MSAATLPTVREALFRFRQANGLCADEATRTSWTCRLGAVMFVLPNFGWRRTAIEAHDIHHVLTNYPCTMCGEFQMAAWEFGAGDMPHWAATLFCLPLVLAGFIWIPRRTFRAFVAGRRSLSLHGSKVSERLRAAPLHVIRDELAVSETVRGSWSNSIRFALLVLHASLIGLSPMAIVIGVWIALGAI